MTSTSWPSWVASADVVIDDGSLEEKLGTPAGDLTENNPSLTWIAISPFGRTGPRRNWRTSNLVAWASSSITYTLGFPDRPPVAPAGPVQLAYHYTSMYAAVAAQLAVRRRKASERGQLIDMSIQEACLSIAPEVGVPVYLDDQVHRPRAGNRRAIAPPVGLYPCEDGYVSIIGLQPAHWRAIAEWIHEKTGNEGVTDEVFLNMQVRWDSSEVINEWTEELCALLTKAELFEDGQRRGIPLTPVNTVADLADDPHLAAVGFFTPVDHPQLGEISIPGAPLRDNCGWWTNVRAPLLGEHTQEILSEL